MDERLKFQNLKKSSFQNEIPQKLAVELWKPYLYFENHNENKRENQLLGYIDGFTSMMIKRNGTGKQVQLSHINEAMNYSSRDTKILMHSFHFLKFTCDFDMHYFPFDHQACFVQVFYKLYFLKMSSIVLHFNTF